MHKASFIIKGKLAGMNEYCDAQRRNVYLGAKMKKHAQEYIQWCIGNANMTCFTGPIVIIYHFYEPTRTRDKDNVSAFAHKVIQDALVKTKIIRNDGWNEVEGFIDFFDCDKENPRIEVEIREGEEWQKLNGIFG